MDWREHITVNPQVCHGIDENLPFKRKSRMPPLSCPLPKIKAAILLRTSTSLQPRTAVQHALYRKAFYIAIGTAVAVSLTACSKSPTLTRTLPLKTISITN